MRFEPVKTAVIGCGMISDCYLRNLKERFSIIELVGCSDLVERKSAAQAEKYGIRQMTNEEILADSSIELVLNLTYASAHFAVSKAILEAGKHCYSEKMMCITMEEADTLNKLRQEKGLLFAAGPDTFLGSGMQTARYAVDKGLIGDVVCGVVHLSRRYAMTKTDRDDAERKYSVMCAGGGIPYDMGGYYLHTLFQVLGPVQRAAGFLRTFRQDRPYLSPRHSKFDETYHIDTYNTVSASLLFRCGVPVTFSLSSDISETKNIFELHGTEGILELGDPNQFESAVTLSKYGNERCPLPPFHPFGEESRGVGAADMAWALRTGRPPRLSFEMGYHALEVLEGIRCCDQEGQVQSFQTEFPKSAPISSEFYPDSSEERSLYLYE